MGPEKSLAFQLFNNYYDVRLANMRGSPWSRNHSRLTVEDRDFWSFSFHEWGRYDLPAIVDHIRNESSFQQLLLIGHSQALNGILVMCSLQLQYNKHLEFVQALASTVALKDHVLFGSENIKKISKFLKTKAKSQEFELLSKTFMRHTCLASKKKERQLLQGSSLKEVQHLQQIWNSEDFVAFNYQPSANLVVYNTVEPLNYDLKKVTVPTVLYYGSTDALASREGVRHIYAHVIEDIRGVYSIAAAEFSHLDFVIFSKVKNLVNNRLLNDLD